MYKYTDKEAQNDLNQNLLDFGWRQYDPVIARWHVTDPAEQFYNPYLAISGNPISIIDPDGRKGTKPPWESTGDPETLTTIPAGGGASSSWYQGSSANTMAAMIENGGFGVQGNIVSYVENGTMQMCISCTVNEMNNGAVVISNTNTGNAAHVINNANSSTQYVINKNGQAGYYVKYQSKLTGKSEKIDTNGDGYTDLIVSDPVETGLKWVKADFGGGMDWDGLSTLSMGLSFSKIYEQAAKAGLAYEMQYAYRGMKATEAVGKSVMNSIVRGSRIAGVGGAVIGTGADILTFINSDKSGADWARLGGTTVILGANFIPVVGPWMSIGLSIMQQNGVFDPVYNSFDRP